MLDKKKLSELNNEFKKNIEYGIRQKILNKVPMVDLITDKETSENLFFDIDIKENMLLDQKHTGRCWIFASSRILNRDVNKNLNTNNFEISSSYIEFYDKLEKFNISMEQLNIEFQNKKDAYNRLTSTILYEGINDGGYFTWFINIINKYGIVPKSIYQENYHTSNSSEVNDILSRLLRKFYLELQSKPFNEIKDKYIESAYSILALTYGLPIDKFDYEYYDLSNKYHIIKDITPLEFYNKFCDKSIMSDYVEVISYQDSKFKYNNYYMVENFSNVSECNNVCFLNLPKDEYMNLVLKQLKDNQLVCFYSYVSKKRIDGLWTDLIKKYGDLLGIDLELDSNDIIKTNETKNGHAMTISGVKFDKNVPVMWKINNSWASKDKNLKYYIADNDWFNKYVSCIIINKKYLSEEQKQTLLTDPIIISRFDNKIN